MCGLCGFGLTDAQMVLELEKPKTQGADRVASALYPMVSKPLSQKPDFVKERAASKRSLHSLIARAFADVQHRWRSGTQASHGL